MNNTTDTVTSLTRSLPGITTEVAMLEAERHRLVHRIDGMIHRLVDADGTAMTVDELDRIIDMAGRIARINRRLRETHERIVRKGE